MAVRRSGTVMVRTRSGMFCNGLLILRGSLGSTVTQRAAPQMQRQIARCAVRDARRNSLKVVAVSIAIAMATAIAIAIAT
jgi:hypothetical protein